MGIEISPELLDIRGVLGSLTTRVEALVIAAVVVGLGFMILNVVAVFKIITKAGYSGWWVLIVGVPLVVWLVGGAVISHAARSSSSTFHIRTFVVWLVLDGTSLLAQWIFFLVFAFSQWPVRRQLRWGLQVPMIPVSPNPATYLSDQLYSAAPGSTISTPALARAGLRCPYCGEPTNPDTRFCATCGQAEP